MSEGTPIPDYHCVKSRFGDRSDKDFVLLFQCSHLSDYCIRICQKKATPIKEYPDGFDEDYGDVP